MASDATSTEPAAGGDAPGVAAFIAKWRAREPEMVYAEVFCPHQVRARLALWGALVFEWRQAAFELSDPRPTEAKCAWWADEALRSAHAAPRHPLTVALSMPELPWRSLADGLIAIAQQEPVRPVDRDGALASVAPMADALAAFECALFEAPATAAARSAIGVHLLCERLRFGVASADGARVPLSLLARHGIGAAALGEPGGEPALRDWARELVAIVPETPIDAPLYRRVRTAFDGWQLRARAEGRIRRMPSLRALLLAWSAARKGRLAG
jgi:hypothetical protein